MYSDSLNYVILAVFASIFTIAGFGEESLSLGLYLARFVFTFLGGLLVTRGDTMCIESFTIALSLSFHIMKDCNVSW